MQDEMESGQAREYQSERAHETVRERAHGSVGYAEWTTSKRGLRLISFPKKQASREEAGEDGPRPRVVLDREKGYFRRLRTWPSCTSTQPRPHPSILGIRLPSPTTLSFDTSFMIPRATIPPNQRGEPWFEDGNIILLTEDADADTTVAFNVHRGVLARHSEVFQSMFELPSPTATDVEVADDCQVVRMHDPPTELSVLIRALYDGP